MENLKNAINEINKVYEHYQKVMEELQSKHETSIDEVFNCDENYDEITWFGDWSKEDVRTYNYCLERSTTLYNAMKIMNEEKAGKF